MPAWFEDPEFHRTLARRGVTLQVKARGWEDYRDVDVALAARSDCRRVLADKPATKLYNAWLAGVPMLASPEPAYCELRRGPFDFIEVRGAADVLAAIDLLRARPRPVPRDGGQRARARDIVRCRGYPRALDAAAGGGCGAGLSCRAHRGTPPVVHVRDGAPESPQPRVPACTCGAESWLGTAAYPSARPTTSPTLPIAPRRRGSIPARRARGPGARRRTSSSGRTRARGARRPEGSSGRALRPAPRSSDSPSRRRRGNAADCRARRRAAGRARDSGSSGRKRDARRAPSRARACRAGTAVACTRNHLSITSASSFHLSWNRASARSRSGARRMQARQASAAIASVMFSARRNSRNASARAVASSITHTYPSAALRSARRPDAAASGE